MKHILALLITLVLLTSCYPVMPQADVDARRTAQAVTPPAPPVSTPAIVPPTATEELLLPTVTPTPECVNAKANISATGERIYHMPGDANYNTVKIDKDGEAIYCTAAEAEAAGFRRALR